MKKLLVYKQSKLEWDSHLTGLSTKQLTKKYKKDGANVDAIVKADSCQRQVRKWMEDQLGQPAETLEDFTFIGPRDNDLVIVLGGDNSFTRVAQFCKNNVILGINSDPDRSVGYMLSTKIYDKKDIEEITTKINHYEYTVEEWPRIQCKIDGKKILAATSELFLGEKLRKNMSRHVIEHTFSKQHEYKREYYDYPPTIIKEHKCSGMIISTGAGSTGWIMSASKWAAYDNTIKEFRYQATEPYGRPDPDLFGDQIFPGDKFKVTSLNDDGIVSVDSWEEWSFNRGAVAEISFGEPLKVLIPNANKDEV